jgi:histidine ammonia-lyase
VERILAIELMSAAQGIDFRKKVVGARAHLGKGTQGVYALLRQHIPFIEADTTMSEFIEKSRQLVATGAVVQSVNNALDS